ncbi:MAG: type II toxin-antitoxin system RelE/ParE family toxin [Sphingobacteriaceae bacterium]|nr:MAG: type II toxin-antitoxin system RelE/ParE family toxin [Sphingobacteriaceae bacterium]
MKYKLVYFDEVRQDVKEAKNWYRQIQPDLAKRFSTAIKESIFRLQKFPTSHAIRYKEVRIAHPKTFPYAIYYYIDEVASYIVIVAIVHTSRNPDFARKRIS